tara:strand:+ start:82 stop:345 length:264 start_codon:yes stop_codon:yes gene_type:complete
MSEIHEFQRKSDKFQQKNAGKSKQNHCWNDAKFHGESESESETFDFMTLFHFLFYFYSLFFIWLSFKNGLSFNFSIAQIFRHEQAPL